MKKNISETNQEVEVTKEEINKHNENIAKLEQDFKEKDEEFKKSQAAYKELRDEIQRKDSEIGAKTAEKQKCEKEKRSTEHERDEKQQEIDNVMNNAKAAVRKMKKLEDMFEWVTVCKQSFGKAGTEFAFDGINYDEAKEMYQQAKDRHKKLSLFINVNAITQTEAFEQEVEQNFIGDLEEMRKTLQKDMAMIQCATNIIDEEKEKALENIFSQVGEDFSSIFEMLMGEGASAKLQELPNNSLLGGLQIRVKLGDVWKESLSELSGRQRSLVALSLILSLLRANQAPFYILDGMDAVLDLADMQNVGQMLCQRFTNSQLIVVSLKEELFSHANVLFRTKFEDGASAVSRIENPRRHDNH